MIARLDDHGDYFTINVADLAAEVVQGIEAAILAGTELVAER